MTKNKVKGVKTIVMTVRRALSSDASLKYLFGLFFQPEAILVPVKMMMNRRVLLMMMKMMMMMMKNQKSKSQHSFSFTFKTFMFVFSLFVSCLSLSLFLVCLTLNVFLLIITDLQLMLYQSNSVL